MKKIIAVGITGASGAVYGIRLTQELLKQDHKVHLIITDAGWQVFREELQWETEDRTKILNEYFQQEGKGELHYHQLRDFTAPIASGSYQTDAMVIIPCSMGTLSGIAHGASGNLMERAADVMLKEGKKLVIVPRESPLNVIHIENMLKLSKMGARIVPAMPGFYQKPETLDDIVNFVVGKVLDSLEVPHALFRRWGE